MTSSKTREGASGATFSPRAQAFASPTVLTDRSHTGRRSRLKAGLASLGGYFVRVSPAVSMFAASLILLAPVNALAQDASANNSVRERSRPEYDPLGMRFGGFTLNASADLAAQSTDNVFALDAGAEEDMIYSIAPEASLRSNWSRHALLVEGGARFENHEDFSDEDAETGFARLYGRLDIGSRSNVAIDAELAHEAEDRTDADAPVLGDRVEFDRSDIALLGEHTFNRVKVSGALMRREYSFDGTQNIRDNEENALRGRLDVEVSPRLGVMLQATADERSYDNNAGLDSEGRRLLAGLTVNFTDLLRGEVAVGQFERDYDNGASVDGLAIDANVEWYPTGLTTVTFEAHRNAEDVVGVSASPFTESEYGLRVDHELLRNVILSAGALTGMREYETIDREDEYMRAEAGADYILNRRVALRARYVFDDLESSGALARPDFEVNAFTLGVSFRL